MTVARSIAPDTSTDTIVLPIDFLETLEIEPGEEGMYQVTYIDDSVQFGKLRYGGPMNVPIPGSNEYRIIPSYIDYTRVFRPGFCKDVRKV